MPEGLRMMSREEANLVGEIVACSSKPLFEIIEDMLKHLNGMQYIPGLPLHLFQKTKGIAAKAGSSINTSSQVETPAGVSAKSAPRQLKMLPEESISSDGWPTNLRQTIYALKDGSFNTVKLDGDAKEFSSRNSWPSSSRAGPLGLGSQGVGIFGAGSVDRIQSSEANVQSNVNGSFLQYLERSMETLGACYSDGTKYEDLHVAATRLGGVQVGHPSYSMKDVFPVGDRGNSFWLQIPPEYQTQNNEGYSDGEVQAAKREKTKAVPANMYYRPDRVRFVTDSGVVRKFPLKPASPCTNVHNRRY